MLLGSPPGGRSMSRPLSFRSLAAFVTPAWVPQSALSPRPLPEPRVVPPAQPGVRVLDQGPVHEGFAVPGAQTRGNEMFAPKAPPPPVPELPPDTKPTGND